MKKIILLLGVLIMLTACERPATFSNWSPINNTTPPDSLSESQQPNNKITQITSTDETPSLLPTLDWNALPEEFPQSMKGFELVSWQIGESWNFTLISGTNREKTFEELMSPDSGVDENGFVKITVSGFAQIKTVFDHLPEESEVFWGGMDLAGQVPEGTLYFSYPPQDSMDDLIAYAKDRGVTLVSLKETE